jgi:hypothetical protein
MAGILFDACRIAQRSRHTVERARLSGQTGGENQFGAEREHRLSAVGTAEIGRKIDRAERQPLTRSAERARSGNAAGGLDKGDDSAAGRALGDRTQRFDWGYGCGECPACKLRAKGWNSYAAGEAGPVGAA